MSMSSSEAALVAAETYAVYNEAVRRVENSTDLLSRPDTTVDLLIIVRNENAEGLSVRFEQEGDSKEVEIVVEQLPSGTILLRVPLVMAEIYAETGE